MNITSLSKQELIELIKKNKYAPSQSLLDNAYALRKQYFGDLIYIRGLIEFTNYCKNNCYYCGIRSGNPHVRRYRLTTDDILSCCTTGYHLGFRTFVLQGGEDPFFTDKKICTLVSSIKERYPDCAVTLSIGEKSRASYEAYFSAGADRYLLRHETATNAHYQRLHPPELTLTNRKRCLYDLKEIGYQVGAGFMVGSPYQTEENLAEDILFLRDLNPHMVGLGPFIPDRNSPFSDYPQGTLNLTLTMLAIVRLTLPSVLLPATTALSTIATEGRIKAFQAGANVVMPNLSPKEHRGDYSLYNNKAVTDGESAQALSLLQKQIERAGFHLSFSRGDSPGWERGRK
jgi:biotin synthase